MKKLLLCFIICFSAILFSSCQKMYKKPTVADFQNAVYSADVQDSRIIISIQNVNTSKLIKRQIKNRKLHKHDFIYEYSIDGMYMLIKSKNSEFNDRLLSIEDLSLIDFPSARTDLIGETNDSLYVANYTDKTVSFFMVNKHNQQIKDLQGSILYEPDFLITKGSYENGAKQLQFSYTNGGKTYLAALDEKGLNNITEINDMYTDCCLLNEKEKIWYAGYNNKTVPYIFAPKTICAQLQKHISYNPIDSIKDEIVLKLCIRKEKQATILCTSGTNVYVYIYENNTWKINKEFKNYEIKSIRLIKDKLYLFNGTNTQVIA